MSKTQVTAQGDFYEEDQTTDAVVTAFDAAPKGVTLPPRGQTAYADTRHDPRAIELVRDRLRHHCGKHAPRSQVMLAIACAGAWCDLSESETAEVLGWFDADPEPVEGKDYLPEPTGWAALSPARIRAAEIDALKGDPS